MEDCAVIMPREGCCARCKGCWYNGTEHSSHTEWNEDGKLLRCEAGVVTISRPECYAPCDNPKHQRHTHYNCPVCEALAQPCLGERPPRRTRRKKTL
ncbi:Crossveinless 2 [Danaus plexippus plexippus]|uniref:Crossveinless 2 n=1 Tax=Danaus plexippus plexippus TaxID=278856 RepID=A0A212FF31_DANPL|nr:Crossveinless 2 [Danaus plexippus plexippus]